MTFPTKQDRFLLSGLRLLTCPHFAVPYWDWTRSKTQCDPAICFEQLLGVTNQVDGTVKAKYFDNWYVICSNEQFLLPDEDVWPAPYGKESSCNFKNILEGYVSAKTGCRWPNVHTLHNQVHIVVGWSHGRCIFGVKRPGLSSSSFLCGSYPSEKWGFAISTRALRFWNIRCTSRTQQRWRHCTTLCCVYSSTDF